MNSELEILKKIWENDGKTYIKLISNQSRFGIDYTRYICNCLFKKGQIQPVKGKRDWYRITSLGKKGLKLRGVIKPEILRKISKKLEKVTYYFPKKLSPRPSEINYQKVSPKSQKVNLIEPKEKKLNLGRSIVKAVSFLKGLKQSLF